MLWIRTTGRRGTPPSARLCFGGTRPVLLLALLLGLAAPALAVDWCFPRLSNIGQPCPDPSQCCSIWGICGAGTHYCKKGHCAGGPCQGAAVITPTTDPEDPFEISDPPPPPPPPAPVEPFDPNDPFDIKPGGQDPSPPPPPRRSPPPSPSPPLPPRPSPSPRPSPQPTSPPPSPQPTSPPPSPQPNPVPPPPPSTTCGVIMEGVDLKGADVAGPRPGARLQACCNMCNTIPGCAAFTFVRAAQLCYFKEASGWSQTPTDGMASVVVGRFPNGIVPAPAPPGAARPNPSPLPPAGRPGEYVFVPMTEEQKRRMYQLTSIFENANTELQYSYAERLGDDRGITYGFCGFTTGTADGLMVVEEYTKIKPGNALERYLPALRNVKMRGDVFTGLNGFEAAVKSVGKDPDFIKAQWIVCDDEYNKPAMEICKQIKCRYALTKAELHDAMVNHGMGLGEKFSIDYILMAAEKAAGGTPATGVEETKWLAAFLKARYDLLMSWDYTSRVSFRRVTMYQRLLELGNLELDGPIYVDLVNRPDTNGKPVWQIRDVYYGTFLIYQNPPPNSKLVLVI